MSTISINTELLPVFTSLSKNIINRAEQDLNNNIKDIFYLKKGVFNYPYHSLDLVQQEYLDFAYYNISNMLYNKLFYSLESDNNINLQIQFEKTKNCDICIIEVINNHEWVLEIYKTNQNIRIYGNLTKNKDIVLELLKLIGANSLIGERTFLKLEKKECNKINTELIDFRFK